MQMKSVDINGRRIKRHVIDRLRRDNSPSLSRQRYLDPCIVCEGKIEKKVLVYRITGAGTKVLHAACKDALLALVPPPPVAKIREPKPKKVVSSPHLNYPTSHTHFQLIDICLKLSHVVDEYFLHEIAELFPSFADRLLDIDNFLIHHDLKKAFNE